MREKSLKTQTFAGPDRGMKKGVKYRPAKGEEDCKKE